jgi:F-type H+-transporting ATPase subunit alpha
MVDRKQKDELDEVLAEAFGALDRAISKHETGLDFEEAGTVSFVGNGIARIRGLPNVCSEELVRFPGGKLGIALNLEPREIAVVLLDHGGGIEAGQEVRRTGRMVDVPVGEGLLGRVVDAKGAPLDNRGPVAAAERWPVERPAPSILDRLPVSMPLQTGIRVIDALIPIGRGQRELILGDRHTGKTAIALDTIINQADNDVICVYCAIEQRASAVARLIDELKQHGVMDKCILVVTSGEDPLGMRFVAPYAATTISEFFMEDGRDVLLVYDDLTSHARAYRELSLLLRRPPAREAYPGDIFYIHSRLLERSTHLKDELGGGSLTSLPIVETEAQNISAYIPTNLISITDGQIYLSPKLFQEGMLPAIDVGRSVSRVGGKAQLPAYKTVAGDLRLSYAQFEELETFSRFGASLEEETRRRLERGRRVREALKQSQFATRTVPEQIAVLLAVSRGYFDGVDMYDLPAAKHRVEEAVSRNLPELCQHILDGGELNESDLEAMTLRIAAAIEAGAPGKNRDTQTADLEAGASETALPGEGGAGDDRGPEGAAPSTKNNEPETEHEKGLG